MRISTEQKTRQIFWIFQILQPRVMYFTTHVDVILLNRLDNSEEKESVKIMNMKECDDTVQLIEWKTQKWTVL
jgi:hypothetical protein